jgi:hypothetical protein
MEIKYLDHFNIRAPKGKLQAVKDFYIEGEKLLESQA